MEQISLPNLKTASTFLTWLTFWLAISTALLGWLAAQVRSETGRRSDLRVANAEQEAANANSTAATANARAEGLKADNLATQERLIAAERSLEAERTARLKLERRIAARHISVDQTKKLHSLLAGQNIVGQERITVAVFVTTETGEAELFANVLGVAMESCGFLINRNRVHYGQPYALHGIGVLVSDDPDALVRGEICTAAFNELGIAAQMLPPRVASRSLSEAAYDQATYIYNQSISLMVGDRPA